MDEIVSVPGITADVLVGVRRSKDGVRRTPIPRWCARGFPWAGSSRGSLNIVDVQGVGRLWNAFDLREVGLAHVNVGRRNAKCRPLVTQIWSQQVVSWLFGQLDTRYECVRCITDDEAITPYLTTRAAVMYIASLGGRKFHHPPDSFFLREKIKRDGPALKFRKTTVERFYAILNSLPPEWTLMVETGAITTTLRGLVKGRVVHLYEAYRYDAADGGDGDARNSGVTVII